MSFIFECERGHTTDPLLAKTVICPRCLTLFVRLRKRNALEKAKQLADLANHKAYKSGLKHLKRAS